MSICVFAAVREELTLLIKEYAARPFTDEAGAQGVYEGRCEAGPLLLAVVGVGVASAAMGIGSVLARARPERAFMVGSAGALPGSGLKVGDLFVSEEEVFAEQGVVKGPGVAESASMKLPGLVQEISLHRGLADALSEASLRGQRTQRGRALTVAGASPNPRVASARAEAFGALCENMEGYALALAGERFGIAVAEIRGISNEAGDRDKRRWDLQGAQEAAQRAVMACIRSQV